jgi:hypothetical protein
MMAMHWSYLDLMALPDDYVPLLLDLLRETKKIE